MRINVELTKEEAKKLLFPKKNYSTVFKKFNNKFKKNLKQHKKGWLFALIIIFFGTIFLSYMIINDVTQSEIKAKERAEKLTFIIDQEVNSNKSTYDLFDNLLRKIIVTLGTRIPLLLVLIAVVWLIHGGFFKIA